MTSRRDFLGVATAGAALAASELMASPPGLAAPGNDTQRGAGQRSRKYVPPIRFGLGGVPLGNEFEVITDEDAYKTLDAAWSAGVRYYDVSPWYGLGLAERRFGYYLHNKNRDGYILSSKVGKLLKASRQNDAKSNFPFSPSPNNEKREKLRAVAAQYGADRRTAALHFSAAPDVAAALIVGARSEEQVLANVTSMQARIPPEFWAELKRRRLIEKNAPTPAEVSGG